MPGDMEEEEEDAGEKVWGDDSIPGSCHKEAVSDRE